ncbi:ABC1 domain containing protein [Fonsecaea pedrosoi]|nr:ABC1 domain containing protein [Fonsecaea pedrosoi]
MKRRNPDAAIDEPTTSPRRVISNSDLTLPSSLQRSISPPLARTPRLSRKSHTYPDSTDPLTTKAVTTAAVEAGQLEIQDHVSFFSSKLLAATRPPGAGTPRLFHTDWLALYRRNLNDRGHHFVVHQHDHPIAGTHYDLRLQCNATSSISFAIMYGLPGDPNSTRLNRNATETRVHNLWNHLIETASHETGTMLLWDTGEYEVLPYESSSGKASAADDTTATEDSDPDSDSDSDLISRGNAESEPSKLHRAFQNRKIKLRLHGTRLPRNYTLSLRLTHDNNRITQPEAPAFKRRKRKSQNSTASARRRLRAEELDTTDSDRAKSPVAAEMTSGSDSDLDRQHRHRAGRSPMLRRSVSSLLRTASPPRPRRSESVIQVPESTPTRISRQPTKADLEHDYDEDEEEAWIRRNNAYPGATNSINSIHQRRWFLSLDRAACGFRPTNQTAFGRKIWERPRLSSSLPEAERRPSSTAAVSSASEPASKTRTRNDRSPNVKEEEQQRQNHAETLGGFPSFHVLGREVEVSVLTGRTAAEVADDEGLVGYKPRGGWRGVVE